MTPLIKAIPIIIITKARWSSNKKYSSSGTNSFYWLNMSETAQIEKGNFLC